jgi:hypothetical protein
MKLAAAILIALMASGCARQEQGQGPAPAPEATQPAPAPISSARSLEELKRLDAEYQSALRQTHLQEMFVEGYSKRVDTLFQAATDLTGLTDRWRITTMYPNLVPEANRLDDLREQLRYAKEEDQKLDPLFTQEEVDILNADRRPKATIAPEVGSVMAKKIAKLEENGWGNWTEDDSIKVINLLSHPNTDSDRKAIKEAEDFNSSNECSSGSCVIIQQEYAAAKLIREGKAKTAVEALHQLQRK